MNKPCQYRQLGINRPPVEVNDIVYLLGCYLYWWSINPQLSVLTWFIHLIVTSTSGLLIPSMSVQTTGTNRPPVEVTTK
jgi:hypothetical protein